MTIDLRGFLESGTPVMAAPGTESVVLGKTNPLATLSLQNGSLLNPSIRFPNNANTGILSNVSQQIDLSFSGVSGVTLSNIGIGLNAASSRMTLGSNGNTILARDAADGFLAQRSGATAQTFRIYKTFTDASNYERVGINNAGADPVIGAEAAGTGTARNLMFQTASSATSIVTKASASQSADIEQWQSSAAAVLAKITSAGYLGLPGGLRFLGFVSSAAVPTTTELPTDKDVAIHRDTALATVRLAYNDGGTIKSVVLA